MNTQAPAQRASTETLKDEYNIWRYQGVLRQGASIIWRCGHSHEARNFDGPVVGRAARTCAVEELARRVAAGEAVEDTGDLPVRRRRPSGSLPGPSSAVVEPWMEIETPF